MVIRQFLLLSSWNVHKSWFRQKTGYDLGLHQKRVCICLSSSSTLSTGAKWQVCESCKLHTTKFNSWTDFYCMKQTRTRAWKQSCSSFTAKCCNPKLTTLHVNSHIDDTHIKPLTTLVLNTFPWCYLDIVQNISDSWSLQTLCGYHSM